MQGKLSREVYKSAVFYNIKKLHPDAILPRYASCGAMGMDLFCYAETSIAAGEVVLVRTGWALEPAPGMAAQIRGRSGLSTKRLLILPNGVGTIDTDYRGELIVPLLNLSGETQVLLAGTAVAQLVPECVPLILLTEVDDISSTSRGSGGFGHTGNC